MVYAAFYDETQMLRNLVLRDRFYKRMKN